MIWGKTTYERDAEQIARHKVKDTGQWVWLEYIWAKDIYRPQQGIQDAHWDTVYYKELPIEPRPIPPTHGASERSASLFCVFCQEKGSTYPVCHACRKAVMAFRAIADA